LVVLGLMDGATTGLAVAAVAGAPRTGTAGERLCDVTHASDAIVFTSQAGIYSDDELGYDDFAELSYVEATGAFGLWYATSPLGGAGGYMSTYGDWLDGLDSPRIVEGRAPPTATTRGDPRQIVMSEPEPGSPLAPLPFLFAVFSLALAVGTLAHISVSVLRRRRGGVGRAAGARAHAAPSARLPGLAGDDPGGGWPARRHTAGSGRRPGRVESGASAARQGLGGRRRWFLSTPRSWRGDDTRAEGFAADLEALLAMLAEGFKLTKPCAERPARRRKQRLVDQGAQQILDHADNPPR
jgi:hypothetical protein